MSACSSGGSTQPVNCTNTQVCVLRKQNRVRKRIIWGIEVAEELQWKDWELGKEITRNLVLKNLSLKIQKMKYRPPKSKFFFTVIPQPILLSPGISFTLPIVFRPLEEKEYLDRLWFEKAEGTFCVDLRAILPRHRLACPAALQLPLCAVGDTVEAGFSLDNVGDLPTFFTWEFPSPFQMFPTTGFLEPGQTFQIKVTFQPLGAVIYNAEATCWYGEGSQHKCNTRLQAVAKCPQLLVSIRHKQPEDQDAPGFQKVLHFGCVAVGCISERQIKLHNPSVVNAPFRIEIAPDLQSKEQAFSCPTTEGVVRPGEMTYVSVFFHPEALDSRTVDYFSITPAGSASQTLLKVVGFCRGPAVSLQQYCVNFSWVNLGERSEQSLWIENQEDCTAFFQFNIDCQESVFSIRPAFGTLHGKARVTLHCTFQPTHPIVYFRRVACLIHHQDPLFLDLIGTCHSDSIKPPILKPRHLAWYRTHLARGLTLYPPHILSTMLKEKKLQQDQNGALMLPMEDLEDMPAPQYPSIPPMTEYFLDGTGNVAIFPPPVTIEPAEVDFGACSGAEAPNPVPLYLMNHTKGKITVVWTHRPDCPFWVTPDTCDVPPLKSMAMRLHFQPLHSNCLYSVELEAFAVYKVLRSYNNIEEDCTVCPSWCLTVHAQGHTYHAAYEHHIPHYSLDVPKLFPAVPSGEPSYRSLLLVNKGLMLLTFNLAPSSSSSDIALRPTSGLVAPGAHQISLICAYPKGTSWKQHNFYLQLNSCLQYLREVTLESREEPVHLQLDTSQSVFFTPTWVGCTSTSTFTFHNPTRLPLEFEWRVSQQHRKMLAVQPSKGLIQPNESITLTWVFSPLEETKYLFQVGMWAWEAGLPLSAKPPSTHYLLRLVGMGISSSISAKEKELDFGNLLVDSKESRFLTLHNEGDCTLYYRLHLEQHSPEADDQSLPALQLDRTDGSLPPHSQDTICLTACPKRRSSYSWTLSYSLLSHRDNKVGEKQELSRVTLEAVYPFLSILDACSMGSAEGITRKHLWRLFSLDMLNSYLERDPTPQELTYKVPTRHSTSQTPPVLTPLKLDFNFGAAPINAPPSVVLLTMKNSGVVPVDWSFLFPSDQQIDLELWAEQAEFDSTELHQMRAQDNCIFSISPKAGSLSPGQEEMVELKYSHVFTGTDRLPVLFKVSYGREILLNFIGVTVRPQQKYVHFTSTSHQFVPVPIGDMMPPRQVDVPIHILGWNSALIRFQGVGYDPHVMGDTAPFYTRSSWDSGSTHSRLLVPGQHVILSQPHISLGNIPVQSKCSRLLFLNNISKNETIVFAWQPNPLDFGEVSVSPMEGEVAPEDTIPFLVTFKASEHASFYSVDLVCKVYRQELMRQYHKELQEWKNEKLRQEVEFTITDKEVKRRSRCTACEPARKYKTLPPIRNQPAPSRPASWDLQIPMEQSSWLCPKPPPPGMLCLGLTARAHGTDYFLANFFSDFSCHFLHRELPKRRVPKQESAVFWEEPSEGRWGPVSKQKRQLLVDCLTTIIRGLLEDKNFHEAMDQSLVEQVPYFCQFWSEQSARFAAKMSSQHLMPVLSFSSSVGQGGKDKEQKDDKLGWGRKDRGEEEEKEEEEEEEEVEEEEGEEEELREEEELSKEDMEEENLTSLENESAQQPESMQQDLKLILKEEQERDEKQAISRLQAFANLQEALLENMILNVLVEASRGEVVLTSRPRIIALPPFSAPRLLNPEQVLPMQKTEGRRQGAPPPTDSMPVCNASPSNLPS
ncbi:cilia- and flagella-associated protein 65 [Ochotona princeps]|uniref:cilia- and flagella-associated protein 65 n=1 Tax=Ochotona princeps TaxID=9978 RepID=UPI00271539E8|nr:cilia- and flagella-associated protein 65 [Ochotona princeps]